MVICKPTNTLKDDITFHNALCPLKAIEPIALFYRYNFKFHFSGHGIGSVAYFYRFFESYFLVLGSILESDRNEKVFNSIALKNRPIAMIKGICSNADVRNLYFKKKHSKVKQNIRMCVFLGEKLF